MLPSVAVLVGQFNTRGTGEGPGIWAVIWVQAGSRILVHVKGRGGGAALISCFMGGLTKAVRLRKAIQAAISLAF